MVGLKTDNFTNKEWKIIEKYSPCLVFDDNEVFYPLQVGCSIITKTQHPPSLYDFYKKHPFRELLKKLEVIALNFIYGRPPIIYNLVKRWFLPISTAYFSGLRVKRAAKVIEYAVFYNSDIQHIYDLEHIWVYLDRNNQPLVVKGTQHGMVVYLYSRPHSINFKDTHPVLIVSPGKHAYYTNINQLNRRILTKVNENPGGNGMYPIQYFSIEEWKKLKEVYPGKYLIKSVYQNKFRSTPSFIYRKYIIPSRNKQGKYGKLVPWSELRKYSFLSVYDHLRKIKELDY